MPLGFAMVEVLEEEQEGDGLVEVGEGKGDGGPRVPRALLRQFLWNRAAAEEGGLGELGVTWRFFEGGEGQGNGGVVKGTGPLERELVFTLKGETIAPRIEGGPIFRDGGGEGENTIT